MRTLYRNAAELRSDWANPASRGELIASLAKRGIAFDELAAATKHPEADPLDLLCHVAFNSPVRTRKERVQRMRDEQRDFFERYSPIARSILEELLDKYMEHGATQFTIPEVLEVPPISEYGNIRDISDCFGGEEILVQAIERLQTLLYAA